MRIFYDHQVFSLQDAGGISRYHYELTRYLSRITEVRTEIAMGFNASVLPFSGLRNERTTIHSWGTRLRPGMARYGCNEIVCSAIALRRGQVDIYHPTLYRRMPAVSARRVVVTHQDCGHEMFPHLFRNPARVIRSKRHLFAQADAIICASESSRRDLLKFYDVPERKTCVIYHGLTRLPRDAKVEEQFRRGIARPYVLYVGSRTQYKNFTGLLRAFAASHAADDFDLVAVGGGPINADELALAKELRIAQTLTVYPAPSDALLAEAYAHATLFVYPSLYEGFGLPPLEAMSLGCPALVSRCSSLPEVCQDGAFYFDPEDPDSLSNRLSEVLGDAVERARMVERAAAIARRYDWNTCGQRTWALYQACLQGRDYAGVAP